MKTNKTLCALAASVAGLFGASSAHALDLAFNPADLILGFRVPSGAGSSTTIMVNLGAASIYRDATSSILNIGNIGSILSATYDDAGTFWYERTTLRAAIVAAVNGIPEDNSGLVAPGQDPNSTVYGTRGRTTNLTTPGIAGSTAPTGLAGAVQPAGSLINATGNVFAANDGNLDGIVSIPTTTPNGWAVAGNVTGSTAPDYGLFDMERAFSAGSVSVFGGSAELALDLYRLPEYVGGNAPGTAGVGSYEGTFLIRQNGQVDFVNVPEPSSLALLTLSAATLGLVRRRKSTLA